MIKIEEFILDGEVEQKFKDLRNIQQGHPVDDEYIIKQQIVVFSDLLRRTRRSLKDIFTTEELYFLFDAFNGVQYCSDLNARNNILFLISDSTALDQLDKKWNISASNLKSKIEKLTEFELFAVSTITNSFWNSAIKPKNDFSELFL